MPHQTNPSESHTTATSAGQTSSTSGDTLTAQDQRFLRLMSDHHLGAIEMARVAMESEGASDTVRAEAEKIGRKQQMGLEQMLQMLAQQADDDYQPKLTPENQRMVERVRAARGPAVNEIFIQTVIEHHEMGLRTLDREQPQLTNPELEAMSQKMRREQQQGIAELQQER